MQLTFAAPIKVLDAHSSIAIRESSQLLDIQPIEGGVKSLQVSLQGPAGITKFMRVQVCRGGRHLTDGLGLLDKVRQRVISDIEHRITPTRFRKLSNAYCANSPGHETLVPDRRDYRIQQRERLWKK